MNVNVFNSVTYPSVLSYRCVLYYSLTIPVGFYLNFGIKPEAGGIKIEPILKRSIFQVDWLIATLISFCSDLSDPGLIQKLVPRNKRDENPSSVSITRFIPGKILRRNKKGSHCSCPSFILKGFVKDPSELCGLIFSQASRPISWLLYKQILSNVWIL